jgi:protease IV
MSTINRLFPSKARAFINSSLNSASAILWCAALILFLGSTTVQARTDDPATQEKPRSIIAVFPLDGPLTEVPPDETFAMFGAQGTSLKDLVARLRKAGEDSSVKAVVLLPDAASLGMGQVEELRAAVSLIRSHDKEVYVHADSLMMGQYVLSCGASRIAVVPTGLVMVPGLDGSSMHIRGLLDKIGVKPDFLTEGAYKSAAELFMREQPSPEADEMMNWLFDSWYASLKDLIAQGRKADAATVQGWVDNGVFTAEQAKAAGLIDAVEHRADFEAMLKEKYGKDVVFDKKYGRQNQADIDFSSPFAFLKIWGELLKGPENKDAAKPAVGIVYVSGTIMDGKAAAGPFGASQGRSAPMFVRLWKRRRRTIRSRRWYCVLTRPAARPLRAKSFLTQPSASRPKTVGGVDGRRGGQRRILRGLRRRHSFRGRDDSDRLHRRVAGKLATTEMWKKVGITFKEYKRGQNAGIFSTDGVFTDSERARMRSFMDDVYGVFKSHVTDIRGSRLKKPIDDLAGGRVYTGKQALELGLVDRIGTMSDAVAFAAEQAKIKDYDTRVVPKPKNFLEQLMEQASGDKDEGGHVGIASGGDSLLKLAAPYLQNIDPRRTAAVASALLRLEILQKEGVVLSMPEILPQQ